MSGYDFVNDPIAPHTGGNVWQGDLWTYAPITWRFMIDRFAVRSVLDVGSGRGHAAHWFHKQGCQVAAIDGSPTNTANALFPTVLFDLTQASLYCPVDLVHCQEVAEHIAEEHIDNLLSTLTSGEVILMTHAEPGQAGHNHVNCQPPEYWQEHLDRRGYNLLTEDTKRVKRIAHHEGAHHLARSGLVFARRTPCL